MSSSNPAPPSSRMASRETYIPLGAERGRISEPQGHLAHEELGRLAVPVPDQPRDHQLGVGIDRGPGPNLMAARRSGRLRLAPPRRAETPKRVDPEAF